VTTPYLLGDLKRDEGLRFAAYHDTEGVCTIGYGHTGREVIPGLVWNQDHCDAALVTDVERAMAECDKHVPWWRDQTPERQDVMVMLMFNMGWGDGTRRLSSFHHTLEFWRTGDYEAAADGLLRSHWAEQVKSRATRLAEQLRTGVRKERI
jgi:lysozyme